MRQDFVRYLLETGLYELCTGYRALRGTYWRRGFVRYALETGLCELCTGDRAWRSTYLM